MPDFEIVSVEEAKRRTATSHRGQYVQEYAWYIQQLGKGQAGKLHLLASEKPATIQRRLAVAAQMLGIPLIDPEADVRPWQI